MLRRRFGRWGSRIYIESPNDGALVLSHFPRCGRLQWWDCSPRLTCFFKISPKYFLNKSLKKYLWKVSNYLQKSTLLAGDQAGNNKIVLRQQLSSRAIIEQLKLVFRDDSKLIFKNWKLWTYLWSPMSTFWIMLSPVHFICCSCDKAHNCRLYPVHWHLEKHKHTGFNFLFNFGKMLHTGVKLY